MTSVSLFSSSTSLLLIIESRDNEVFNFSFKVLLSIVITVEFSKLNSSKLDNSFVRVWSRLLDPVSILISGQNLQWYSLVLSEFSLDMLRLLIKVLSKLESSSWKVSSNSWSAEKGLEISLYLLLTIISIRRTRKEEILLVLKTGGDALAFGGRAEGRC